MSTIVAVRRLQRAFAWVVTTLCLLAAIAYVSEPIDRDKVQTAPVSGQTSQTAEGTPAKSGQPKSSTEFVRTAFKISLLLAAGSAAAWFAFAFTGDPLQRRDEQVKFAYFFVIASFAVLTIPPFVKSQAIGNEPIGIISGCINDTEAVQLSCSGTQDRLPNQAIANSPAPPGTATAPVRPAPPAGTKNQWLVNIGGALVPQSTAACTGADWNCKLGSPGNRAIVSGGVVVPLPFVIIALFGGAISLSRRVPEIQKRSEPNYVGTDAEPALEMPQAREFLAFQIMQFISAPLIAITAHQVIEPESHASAVSLAFLAGFGSETILLMIRGVANGLQPRSAAGPSAVRPAIGAGPAGRGATAGTAPVATEVTAGQEAPLVNIRLSVDTETLDAGSLVLTVDGTPVELTAHGLVELALETGREHKLEASAQRNGQPLRAQRVLNLSVDDEGSPFELTLA